MSWLNPAAFFGLLAVAVPVFVHLFGRRVAKRQRFPSLRLLQLATPSASSRSEPSDVLLMLVRSALVGAAALALAQPLWPSPDRADRAMLPARAIIVDTSGSMRRRMSDGSSALDRARTMARAQLDSAREGIMIETSMPGANIRAGASWLETQSGSRQVVVISDFQRGAVQDGDLAHLATGIGFRPMRVDVSPQDSVLTDVLFGRVTMRARETVAAWNNSVAAGDSFPVAILSSPGDSLEVRSSLVAARQLVPIVDGVRNIAVLYPGYAGAPELVRQGTRLNKPWQGDFLLRVRTQPLISQAAPDRPASDCGGLQSAPVHNATGDVIATVAAGVGSQPELLVFSCAKAGSTSGTALLTAVALAAIPITALSEAEPTVLPDEQLTTWERPPTEMGPVGIDETSPDGRWLWLVALLLLVVEEWIRRGRPRRTVEEASTERRQRVA
jgi:hypothetical protein